MAPNSYWADDDLAPTQKGTKPMLSFANGCADLSSTSRDLRSFGPF
jgi:hypothetical protein